ncbi:glycosyltransferase family 2 protein [Haloferax gibbonsii]|uniref:glycosyltransferase family 2 protein n=1 Tax=Haloferax gibbonsii TaxID=35746 RepID=UPI00187630C8|nr:glycosyltransferase [Haloferax gibbonsii]
MVIPAFNAESTISNAIESVLSQSYTDYEIIVVDDGSKDNTVSVVKNKFDKDVRLIQHSSNKGAPAARNTGINTSNGDYISFLDSDDQYSELKLKKQYEYLKRKEEDYVAVHSKEKKEQSSFPRKIEDYVGQRLQIFKTYDEDQPASKHKLDLLSADSKFGNTSTLMVEAQAIKAIGGFDESFQRHQDWEFLIRLLDVGKIAFVNEPLVIRGDTGRPSAYRYEIEKARYLRKYKQLVNEFESSGFQITKYNNLELCKFFLRDGDLSRARYYLKRSDFKNAIQILALLWSVALYSFSKIKNRIN